MERDRFARHFADAAVASRDLARGYLREALPDAMRFCVLLNSRNDHKRENVARFPEDSRRSFNDLSAEEVIDVLWRDGLVPQWIDIAVIGETGAATRLKLTVCERFTADDRLYYTWTQVPPFGVKGPTFPYGYVEGERFSIYNRANCISLAELSRAQAHATEVWSLDIEGDAFDDDVIAALRFPAVEIITVTGAGVHGRGLASLRGMPKLRIVRVASTNASIDISQMPETLDEIWLRGYSRIIGRTRAKLLLLAGTRVTKVDGPWSTEGVQTLTLAYPTVPRWIRLSPSLSSLHIQCHASDDEVEELLAGCGDALDHVTLRGERVTDQILNVLARFPKLRFFDVVDTRVTKKALRAFVAQHPGVHFLPSVE